jgi:hypothetical protein
VSDPQACSRAINPAQGVTDRRAVQRRPIASGIGPEPHVAIRHVDIAVPGFAERNSAAEQEETDMPNISRAFFYLTDLPNRWGRSLSEVGGWALAGRLNLMVPIPPVKCGDQTATGIVRVLAEDVARLFHPGNHANFSCTVLRILPTDALAPLCVTEPVGGIDVRLGDLLLDAEEVSDFEQVNELLSIGKRTRQIKAGGNASQGRPAVYEWEAMLVDVVIDLSANGLPRRQDDFVQLILDWFTENSADGKVPDASTVRKRCARIWWRLQDRL